MKHVFLILLLVLAGCKTNNDVPEVKAPAVSDEEFVAACMRGDVPTVKRMLDSGANPDALLHGETTCLIQISASDNRKLINLLLEAGADANVQRATDGYTALMSAARQGWVENVRLLLKAGADPIVKNNFGQTAKEIAIMKGHRSLAELL